MDTRTTASCLVAGSLAAFMTACTGQRAPERVDPERRAAPSSGAAGGAEEGTMASRSGGDDTTQPAQPSGDKTEPATRPGGDEKTRSSGAGAAMAATARALLDAAGGARGRLAFPFDSGEREDWHYTPRSRPGFALGDMSAAQRTAAWALFDAGLSPAGREKVKGILTIEPILGQIEGNTGFRDPGRYHVAVFGTPGAEGAWAWRLEGHHLSLHFTMGTSVATTPAFLGANPARVATGKSRGLRVLAAEEDLGRALFISLSGEQRRRAVLSASAPSDIVTEASRRVALARFEGLPARDMTDDQRAALLRLLAVYAENFAPDLAHAHLARIRGAGLERLHFAWAGSAEPGQSHYYRVHGPTHLVEYDNRGGNHIHTVFRDLDHDFGDGLLARHLREHHR